MIVDKFRVDKDLVIEFFCVFSRFEYAMKRTGFATGCEKRVDPDWNGLAKKLQGLEEKDLAPILGCCQYLRQNPPKKQVLRKGRLAWDICNASSSGVGQLLLAIRCVRNNLFHGGKFPLPDGSVDEIARNRQLLEESVNVLIKILELPEMEKLRTAFDTDDSGG